MVPEASVLLILRRKKLRNIYTKCFGEYLKRAQGDVTFLSLD